MDWFQIPAEANDPCPPLLEQCLTLTARIIVPAGRRLRLCLREKACEAAESCAESPSTGAVHELSVALKHTSLCTPLLPPFAQTTGLASVSCLDGKSECAAYSIAGRFEICK